MIFVTGGTGLVGSHVLLNLSRRGKKFKALKRISSSLKVCKKVFLYYNEEKLFQQINWIDGDLNDISSLEEGMKNCIMILHCAALVSFHSGDLAMLKKVNIEGTANLVNIALSSSIKKIGYVSSIATLGKDSDVINEESYFKFNKSESNYSISKYYAEQEVWRISQEGIDVVVVNPSVILGPGEWSKGSSQIFTKIYEGLKYYTEGATGYVDVLDVSEALIQLLFSKEKNERFILNGANLKYRVCFDMIAERLGKNKATIRVTPLLKEIAWRMEAVRCFFLRKKPLITKETANNAMNYRTFSSKKIEERLGYEFIDIKYTIKKYCDWFIADLKNPFH